MNKVKSNGLMKIFVTATLILVLSEAFGQLITMAPYGGNKRSVVGETIGLTEITINYNAPGVKGREGRIWGELIHYGFKKLDYATDTASPWRAGANENTTFNFTTPVKINGYDLPAGKYGFFVAFGRQQSTLIFSKNFNSWGSYFYDPGEDALRVVVNNIALDSSVEWLKYDFSERTDSSSVVALSWEKVRIPLTISVDLIETQLNSFRRELRGDKGFLWENWQQAAVYCLHKNINLGEALHWINMAICPDSNTVTSDSGFINLIIKGQILQRLNRENEAMTTFKAAALKARPEELYNYAGTLITKHKTEFALQLLQWGNYMNRDQFYIDAGLAKAYSTLGDYKVALKYSRKAKLLSPPTMKAEFESWILKLRSGKPIS
jgi:tetratricopeptide (TPR) repeat protein